MSREKPRIAAMDPMTRASETIGRLIWILAGAVLAVVFFLPVYTDEILWKLLLGRYHADGNQELALTLIPSCRFYAKDVPWLLLPYRLFNELLYGNIPGPLSIRIFGFALELLWLGLTMRLFATVVRPRIGSFTAATGVLAFAMLGILPFMLEFGRPEQILLIGITILFVPLLKPASPELPGLGTSLLHALLICVGAGFFLTTHPRANFALPLILAFSQRVLRRPWLTFMSFGVILAFDAVAYGDWAARWNCPHDPVVALTFRRLNLGANHSLADFQSYFSALDKSFENSGSWFLADIIQKPRYTSDMIPPYTGIGWLVIGRLLWAWLSYIFLIGSAAVIVSWWTRWRERELRMSLVALAAMWLFFAASIIARIDKNDYEAELIVPLVGIGTAGAVWIAWPSLIALIGTDSAHRMARFGCMVTLSFALLSQAGLIVNYAPYVFWSWTKAGYPKGQRVSVGNFGYDSLRAGIIEAAEKCGIRLQDYPRHLVVDELTYFTFQQAYQPFFMTELDEHGWSTHHPDPTDTLFYFKSDGMIVGCQWIPTVYKHRAVADGKFCCLPKFY